MRQNSKFVNIHSAAANFEFFARYINFENRCYKNTKIMEPVFTIHVEKAPSLLRQIVDEVDAMDETEKEELLRKIKLSKALSLAQKADQILEGKFKPLSEDEIAEMVSSNRKQRYEEKNS